MEAYQHRVLQEKQDLDVKIRRLREFTESAGFTNLPAAEQQRMQRQLTHMVGYSEALHERIEAFKNEGTGA